VTDITQCWQVSPATVTQVRKGASTAMGASPGREQ
jgi:hypothetical protein